MRFEFKKVDLADPDFTFDLNLSKTTSSYFSI